MSETQTPAIRRTNDEMFAPGLTTEGHFWVKTSPNDPPKVCFVTRYYGKTSIVFLFLPTISVKHFKKACPDAQWGEKLAAFGE